MNLTIVLELGKLTIYEADVDGENQYFWATEKNPDGYGPFASIHSAVSHANLIEPSKKPELRKDVMSIVPGTNVVHVDFKNKCKIAKTA